MLLTTTWLQYFGQISFDLMFLSLQKDAKQFCNSILLIVLRNKVNETVFPTTVMLKLYIASVLAPCNNERAIRLIQVGLLTMSTFILYGITALFALFRDKPTSKSPET